MKMGLLGNKECGVSMDAVECLVEINAKYDGVNLLKEALDFKEDEVYNFYDYIVLQMTLMQGFDNLNAVKYISKKVDSFTKEDASIIVDNAEKIMINLLRNKKAFTYILKIFGSFQLRLDETDEDLKINVGSFQCSDVKSIKDAIKKASGK